jgi:hypothetical protein
MQLIELQDAEAPAHAERRLAGEATARGVEVYRD